MNISQEDFVPLDPSELLQNHSHGSQMHYWRGAWAHLRQDRLACLCAMFILTVTLFAILAPMLNPISYDYVDMPNMNRALDSTYLFGTDTLGRDLWSRVWMGTRVSLLIGLAGAILPQLIGFAVGSTAGYCGGWVDIIIMGIVDVGVCIPSLVYVTLISLWFGSDPSAVVLAIAISSWMDSARMVRSRIVQFRNREFVLSAQIQGASALRLIAIHILPNILGHCIVSTVAAVPTAIFMEAYLSFIGLGVGSPMTSLGQLCKSGAGIYRLYSYQLFIPGLIISLIILAFYILGNSMRDALDPQLQLKRN